MEKTKTAGGVVINRHSRHILVVNQNGLSWSLPKGHVEKGESAREAALREIEEESGLTEVTIVKELGTYQRYKLAVDGSDDMMHHKTITMFLCTTDQDHLRPIDPENPEARWVEPHKVADLLSHRKDKAFFTEHLPAITEFIGSLLTY